MSGRVSFLRCDFRRSLYELDLQTQAPSSRGCPGDGSGGAEVSTVQGPHVRFNFVGSVSCLPNRKRRADHKSEGRNVRKDKSLVRTRGECMEGRLCIGPSIQDITV